MWDKVFVSAGLPVEEAKEMSAGYTGRNVNNSLRCPKCSGQMVVAMLSDNRRVRYCKVDRVCLPLNQ